MGIDYSGATVSYTGTGTKPSITGSEVRFGRDLWQVRAQIYDPSSNGPVAWGPGKEFVCPSQMWHAARKLVESDLEGIDDLLPRFEMLRQEGAISNGITYSRNPRGDSFRVYDNTIGAASQIIPALHDCYIFFQGLPAMDGFLDHITAMNITELRRAFGCLLDVMPYVGQDFVWDAATGTGVDPKRHHIIGGTLREATSRGLQLFALAQLHEHDGLSELAQSLEGLR